MESSSQNSHEKNLLLVLMEIYGNAGTARMLEAERLIAAGMDMRDDAKAMFDRANELALEYARKPSQVIVVQEDDSQIPF
jgi:hypothetical protein